MRQTTIIFLLVMTFLAGSAVPGYAWGKKKKAKGKAEMQAPKKLSPYERLFEGKKCETARGFLTLHKMDGKIYAEFPLKYMDRDMLIGSTVSEISDNRFALVGEITHQPLHVMFSLRDSAVDLLHRDNCLYVTDDGDIAGRLKISMKDPLMERFKIEAWTPDRSAVVVDLTDFLLSDRESMAPNTVNSDASAGGQHQRDTAFYRDKSMIAGIKAFSDNESIQSLLSYMSGARGKNPRGGIPRRPFTALMTRSFVLLSEEPMRPREGDPRMNVFVNQKICFDKDKGAYPLFYTMRRRLEPIDEEAWKRGEMVEPKQPIVYYVDDAFPEEWKKYVKAGVEIWQKAFEKIGFKNAIQARDFPRDNPEFDPDNLKYSCIRYCPIAVPNAMGMPLTDPRSSEIINATVYIYHNVVDMLQSWRFIQTAAADGEIRKVKMPEELLGNSLSYVIAHEVGHTLGFMHNMASSSAIPVDSLRSPSFTQKFGTTYSIMDYARNNYVAQPGDKERGVRLTPPDLGEYDYYAVKWLYSPLPEAKTPEEEKKILCRWIDEKSGNPIYRYGKQQLQFRIDPTSVEEDLGDDAVKAAGYGIQNLKYIMAHLDEWVGGEDADFSFRKRMYNELLFQYSRFITHVMENIGGIEVNEHRDGDRWEAFRPLPAEKQKQAVQFLFRQLKDLQWLDSENLQRGYPMAGNVSGEILTSVFKGMVSRIEPLSLCESKTPENKYTPSDFLNDLGKFVWTPTENGKTLTQVEKKLQQEHLTMLIVGSMVDRKDLRGANLNALTGWTGSVVPDFVKANSRADNGDISEQMAGIFTNRDYLQANDYAEGEQYMGFGENPIRITGWPVETDMLETLLDVQKLIKRKAATGSEDTRRHYRLLLFKIEKALEK